MNHNGIDYQPCCFLSLRYCDDKNAKPSRCSRQSLKTTALQLMAMAHNNGSWLDMADWTALFRS
jgi:hypothetical protein